MVYRPAYVAARRKSANDLERTFCQMVAYPRVASPTAETQFGTIHRRNSKQYRKKVGLTTKQPLPSVQKSGIGIAPFAAHKGKLYPLARMERVVAMLSERGEKIVLFGSKDEREALDKWAAKYPNVVCIAGQKSLAEELDMIRGLRVMVSMDSANMHLASLVGTRVVSIWGATHPNAGFLGIGQSESDCVQRDLKCRPCSVYGNKRCKYGDYRCLDIEPEEIVARI